MRLSKVVPGLVPCGGTSINGSTALFYQKRAGGLHDCKGGATVEIIMIMSLLLPILFGLVMIGKLIDIRQVAEQASRYAAWQTTVHSRASLSNDQSIVIHNRFFADPERYIKTQADSRFSSNDKTNRLWGQSNLSNPNTSSSQTHIQIENDGQVLTEYSFNLSAAPVATGMGETVERLGSILDGANGNSWDLEGNGIVKADVDVGVKANGWLTGSNRGCLTTDSRMCVQSSSVIMSDGWSADSDDHAKERARSLMPTSVAQPLSDVVGQVGGLLFPELKGLKGAFGHVDMGVLPRYAR
jgi:hypothetical protein